MSHLDELSRLEDSAVARRHIGPGPDDIVEMLKLVGADSLEAMAARTVPAAIAGADLAGLPPPATEAEAIAELRALSERNARTKSLIGLGYHGTHTPPVILRNVLENPGWYTAYTPYQAEIAQGRLEALVNFQTMITDLTGLPVANASLLDEATAAAEAVTLAHAAHKGKGDTLLVAADLHPQTLAVVRVRAAPVGIRVVVVPPAGVIAAAAAEKPFALLLQYPGTTGEVRDLTAEIAAVQAAGGLAIVAADPLALTLLTPPGEMGADVVVGSSQRFGVPLGYGGPHAAYMAVKDGLKRLLPGRLVGVSIDAAGNPAMRLALQTREQHIRREKATSNICTAQVLLAVIAGMYAVWHGPEGLKRIARRVSLQARLLADAARRGGYALRHAGFFDTIAIEAGDRADALMAAALERGFNLWRADAGCVSIALDETVTRAELASLADLLGGGDLASLSPGAGCRRRWRARPLLRCRGVQQPPFGACDAPLPEAAGGQGRRAEPQHDPAGVLHDEAERDGGDDPGHLPRLRQHSSLRACGAGGGLFRAGQAAGRLALRRHRLRRRLAAAECRQPGRVCRAAGHPRLPSRQWGDAPRRLPHSSSAHGTNPASAVMAGMRVVVVGCDRDGNVDLADLEAKTAQHADRLSALMVTYPSTHGVFEESIREICALVHRHGGQVYMDGANMNAQVGLTSPAAIGADVCHLNLHKTFCIPHGGGGPGVGPIGVAAHLAPHLPNHPLHPGAGPASGYGPVSAAPFGSAAILPISYAYIRMMGAEGLTRATQVAILSANYVARRLEAHYPVLYRGLRGMVAHECILDCRGFQQGGGVLVEDIAKRLQDYGYHAPTMSWPVAGTLMVEPTESEPKEELDRFCDAMIAIRAEIRAVEQGRSDKADNPLKNAPHTAAEVMATEWRHPYSREEAAFPLRFVRAHKYWPPVKRVDNVHGDRNLVCTCAPLEEYAQAMQLQAAE
ncbi:glycine dehydrogenase (aminomethyl-transferring) [Siccirubricoccus deserti]